MSAVTSESGLRRGIRCLVRFVRTETRFAHRRGAMFDLLHMLDSDPNHWSWAIFVWSPNTDSTILVTHVVYTLPMPHYHHAKSDVQVFVRATRSTALEAVTESLKSRVPDEALTDEWQESFELCVRCVDKSVKYFLTFPTSISSVSGPTTPSTILGFEVYSPSRPRRFYSLWLVSVSYYSGEGFHTVWERRLTEKYMPRSLLH